MDIQSLNDGGNSDSPNRNFQTDSYLHRCMYCHCDSLYMISSVPNLKLLQVIYRK